jgi:hypothetical protein
MYWQQHLKWQKIRQFCQLNIRITYCMVIGKKTQPAGGKTTPCGIVLLEEDLTQAEKIPKPLSHPYTRATPSHVSVGQGLKPMLWRVERWGDFFNQSRNSLPEGIESGTSGVATQSSNHYAATLSHCMVIEQYLLQGSTRSNNALNLYVIWTVNFKNATAEAT